MRLRRRCFSTAAASTVMAAARSLLAWIWSKKRQSTGKALANAAGLRLALPLSGRHTARCARAHMVITQQLTWSGREQCSEQCNVHECAAGQWLGWLPLALRAHRPRLLQRLLELACGGRWRTKPALVMCSTLTEQAAGAGLSIIPTHPQTCVHGGLNAAKAKRPPHTRQTCMRQAAAQDVRQQQQLL